jgi:hypothetical protein
MERSLDRDELKGTVTTGERRVDIVLKKRKD